ncbi:putative fatty acyl-CoA reductase 4 [Dichanthelium oligosanthes]|uniref:Fatty acyl-CoA reductase n=1 Tax=Dichanthelium oligosanthes TaxID=888268 RepID=A0A1E5WL99_9POAL|nr:putative fatty acyl-CoA reductase 4 [Dichanthelium oligosanthes]
MGEKRRGGRIWIDGGAEEPSNDAARRRPTTFLNAVALGNVVILVEKILRVQPDVKRIYLPVRAPDAESAKKRVETEVIGKELFGLLRETHGKGFQSFIEEKVVPLAGDIIHENFGVEGHQLSQMTQEINVIVNGAATTNFYERYDVALDVNVMGVKHMCQLAKQCPNLKVILHVSTAYVVGERQGVIQERPFKQGETLREDAQLQLDVDAELRLARDYQRQLAGDDAEQKNERKAMKELGLARAREFGWPNTYVFTKALGEMTLAQQLGGEGDVPVVIVRPSIITSIQKDPLPGWIEGTRTIDAILIGYAKQSLSCFLADLDLTMDVIPGDMVVNAMMAATMAHASPGRRLPQPTVYHATSSLRNPAPYAVLYRTGIRYFSANPRVGSDGRPVRTRQVHFFATIAAFTAYMVLRYRLPLELLRLLNLLCLGLLSRLYGELSRKYTFVMRLVDLYGPFALFRGIFDDANTEKLRLAMAAGDRVDFNFDPRSIDWDDYFYRIHIPGVMKYVLK